jgi:hypothetical protein
MRFSYAIKTDEVFGTHTGSGQLFAPRQIKMLCFLSKAKSERDALTHVPQRDVRRDPLLHEPAQKFCNISIAHMAENCWLAMAAMPLLIRA